MRRAGGEATVADEPVRWTLAEQEFVGQLDEPATSQTQRNSAIAMLRERIKRTAVTFDSSEN